MSALCQKQTLRILRASLLEMGTYSTWENGAAQAQPAYHKYSFSLSLVPPGLRRISPQRTVVNKSKQSRLPSSRAVPDPAPHSPNPTAIPSGETVVPYSEPVSKLRPCRRWPKKSDSISTAGSLQESNSLSS